MMNTEQWGLTEHGFVRPSYSELLDAYEQQAREKFGPTAKLTARSPLGIWLRIFAWFTSMLFGVLESVYNSRFVDTADGTSLYNLGRTIGIRLLSNQKAVGHLCIEGAPGTVIPPGWLASTTAGVMFVVTTKGVVDSSGAVMVPAQAVEPGEVGNQAPHTITTIVNPVIPAGVDSVTNPGPFVGGRLRESDEEFRDRYYKSVDRASGVNAAAIRAAILQDVEGVVDAEVLENDTDYHDPETGLPPHSIEAVVVGGEDEDIARVIKNAKSAGVRTHGGITVPVDSDSGRQRLLINFERPAQVPVWVQFWNIKTEKGQFPNDGYERLKQAVIDYIGDETANRGIGIGEKLRYKWLSAALVKGRRSVPGLLNFEMVISGDGIDYGYADIPVSHRQKAATDMSKITIA